MSENELIRKALEEKEQEKQNVIVESNTTKQEASSANNTNETKFLSTEGRLFQKLIDHESYMLKLTPPGVEYNRSADPTYVRLYVDLSYERRRINEMRQEQHRIDCEEGERNGREIYYNNKLAAETPERREQIAKQEKQIEEKYHDLKNELETDRQKHIRTMNNFFNALPNEIEEFLLMKHEASESPCWPVITEYGNGMYSCDLHKYQGTHFSLASVEKHVFADEEEHRQKMLEVIDEEYNNGLAQITEEHNKAIENQKSNLISQWSRQDTLNDRQQELKKEEAIRSKLLPGTQKKQHPLKQYKQREV